MYIKCPVAHWLVPIQIWVKVHLGKCAVVDGQPAKGHLVPAEKTHNITWAGKARQLNMEKHAHVYK